MSPLWSFLLKLFILGMLAISFYFDYKTATFNRDIIDKQKEIIQKLSKPTIVHHYGRYWPY